MDLVGRLSAYRSADVRARVAGVLLHRRYDEGSDVEQGQLLFEIDPAPLKAALNASLAAQAQAQAGYTNAHVAAERARSLAPKGYVSRSDLDNAQAAERTAAAAIKAARADVDTAKIHLGYASVRAPIAGRAGKQQVTEGALVGQNEATLLTTIEQVDPIYVNFTMSVNDMEWLRAARAGGGVALAGDDESSVRLTLSDGSAYGQVGTVDFSDTAVDPSTGAVSLRARMPNPDHALLPGMYVTLRATLGRRHGVYFVPQPAVQRDTHGAYVLVVDGDGKVERKDVRADTVEDGSWLVTQGLADGDRIIVSGLQKARVGTPARAVPVPANAPATSAATPAPAGAGKN
jgi:membrane fusion protein (multidrug efflux system)